MNVAVYLADQNPYRDRSMGITDMTDVLLRGMIGKYDFIWETICSRSSYTLNDERVLQRVLPWRSDRIPGRLLADNVHPFIGRTKPDIWFYPKGFLPYVRRPSRPCVGIIHDTILLWSYDHYPQERSHMNYRYWLNNLRRSIARLDIVMTVSQSARGQIEEFCQRFEIDTPQIEVVYESPGVMEIPANIESSDFVVHIASRAPHKRTEWLIREWLLALKRGIELPQLLLIGSLPYGCRGLIESADGIEKTQCLSNEDYRRTIAAARALILPSEIEGFGLPALEAYLLGTPVCYASGTAVEEILDMPDQIGAFTFSAPESLFVALDQVCWIEQTLMDETVSRLRRQYDPERFAGRVATIFYDMV